jgi:hypothetical protein
MSKVEELELIGGRQIELGHLDVDAAHPRSIGLQALDQVARDKYAGSTDDDVRHPASPLGFAIDWVQIITIYRTV